MPNIVSIRASINVAVDSLICLCIQINVSSTLDFRAIYFAQVITVSHVDYKHFILHEQCMYSSYMSTALRLLFQVTVLFIPCECRVQQILLHILFICLSFYFIYHTSVFKSNVLFGTYISIKFCWNVEVY